jgi:ribonuclease HI
MSDRTASSGYPPSQRLRCPCCGEIFTLADAEVVADVVPVVPAEVDAAAPIPDSAGAQLPITLVFDGGSIGNPGRGYGSYRLTVRGKAEAPKRLEFGDQHTNNEAEYDTLLAALEAILRRAKDPRRVRLAIRGDSQLVINQINGVWKAKDARMKERLERARALLEQFGGWTATWHERGKSVRALGH